jgi:hypothetical protein
MGWVAPPRRRGGRDSALGRVFRLRGTERPLTPCFGPSAACRSAAPSARSAP